MVHLHNIKQFYIFNFPLNKSTITIKISVETLQLLKEQVRKNPAVCLFIIIRYQLYKQTV